MTMTTPRRTDITHRALRRAVAAVALAAALALAAPPVTHGAALWDTAGHWARAEIAAGVAAGYISGFPDGSFRPDQPMTRAEFYTLLTGALGLAPRPGDSAPYAAGHWAARQGRLQAAAAAGLLDPADYGGWLAPDEPVTRREIVLAGVRALGRAHLVGGRALASADAASYPDWLQAWAAEAVHLGILQGYADGALGLDRTATRAEALVMVQRIRYALLAEVAETDEDAVPGARRYPAPGEPTWTVDSGSPARPVFSDGRHGYALNAAVAGYTLLPAPGRAAWLSTVDGGGTYRLYWLADGRAAEVARGAEPIAALAVAEDGRLWFSRGREILAAAEGGIVERHTLAGQATFGALDGAGALWAVDSTNLYRVAGGKADRYLLPSPLLARVRYVAPAADGSVWLLLRSEEMGGGVGAVRIRGGRVAQEVSLIGGGPQARTAHVQAAVLARRGDDLLILVTAPERAVIRFDLAEGAAARLVLPPEVGEGAQVVPAADGGALVLGRQGRRWRIVD